MTLRATTALLCALTLPACEQQRVLFSDDARVDATEDAALDATTDTTDAARDAPPDAPVTCESATSCRGCDAVNGCGWCSIDGRCHPGTAAGPTGSTCVPTAWQWDPTTCPADDCDRALDCDQCMLRAGCGWCSGTNRCTAGDATGPNDATCGGGEWAWLSSACPGGCPREPTCIGCQTRSGCGWCVSRDACVPASPDGSRAADGMCSGDDWVPSNGTCLSGDDLCRGWNTVDLCVNNAMAMFHGCGWCTTRGKAGRCLGRATETCPGDAWVEPSDGGMTP